MRPDRWEQTYVEFVTARQHELRQVALAAYRDPVRAEDALRRGLTELYLAWPRVRREGIEDAEALRLVAGTRAGPAPGDGGLLVSDPEAPPHLVEEYVAAGRSARRRRRRTAAAAGLVAALATAAVTLAVLPRDGGGGIGPDPLPPHPTASTMPIPVTLLVPPKRYVHSDSPPVFYLYGRMFKRSHDVTVLTTSGTPEPSTHPRGGAIVRVAGATSWVVTVGSQPEALTEERAGPYDPDAFRAWLGTEQLVLSGRLALAATAPGGYRAPVTDEDSPAIFAGTRLVAKAGGAVTQRIARPVVSRYVVPACHDQAVRIHTPTQDWFVLGYECASGSALFSEPVGVRATSLETWLARVRRVQDRYIV